MFNTIQGLDFSNDDEESKRRQDIDRLIAQLTPSSSSEGEEDLFGDKGALEKALTKEAANQFIDDAQMKRSRFDSRLSAGDMYQIIFS